MSNVRVVATRKPGWRAAKIADHDAEAARIEAQLADLADLEAMLGDEEDVAHNARVLAASLRTVRNDRQRRAAILAAAIAEEANERRAG